MNLHNDILESIGNTPMVKVNNIDTGKCDLFLKLENLNPGGSIKDSFMLFPTLSLMEPPGFKIGKSKSRRLHQG